MAGQFRILQNRLQNMYSLQRNNEKHETPNTWTAKKYYSTIKNCIRQHQTLIMHSNELEEIFSPIILAQVLAFSLLICLSGYQIVLADLSSIRRCTFVALLISTMCQLFMFTYSCDCLIQESSGVSGAVYAGVWIELPMDRFGKLFRKDLQMVVMRSRRPCCLTANKFFAVSLETYTSMSVYMVFNILYVNMIMVKTVTFAIKKQKFLNLIQFMRKYFWHTNYTPYEQAIFNRWKRICLCFIACFVFFTDSADLSLIVVPIIDNIGKNESERVLPFNAWPNLPSPYFEIAFMLQVLLMFNLNACYVSFENFFCIINLHMAAQFRILQNRLQNINSLQINKKPDTYTAQNFYNAMKNCIQQHQLLVIYSGESEEIFSVFILWQILTFSVLIGMCGFQLLEVEDTSVSRTTLVAELVGVLIQLFMFTYSCDSLIQESTAVSEAIYTVAWAELPMDKFGKRFRKDLQFMVMRSRRPCFLTAGKFFMVSMKTYINILSSAMSYFSLIRQRTSNI
nr:uncharacterized protein LOC116432310 [Nomia melanderi]